MDISQSNWNEVDNSNSTASPDGAPEGMAASGVNDTMRAMMGATKRFWNKINAVKTTAGTSSAFTLAYDVAPTAYADGEIISFVVNAANAVDATLNVNALGAIPLRLFGGNLLAGALQPDQILQARYNSSAGAFDLITTKGWNVLATAAPSGAATVDFAGIPAGVNNLMAMFEVGVSTTGAALCLRTYGADGVLDTGASDYYYNNFAINTAGASSVSASTTNLMALTANGADSGTSGVGGDFTASYIQAARFTKFNWRVDHQNTGDGFGTIGYGARSEAARITGLRFLVTSGTMTGGITLLASV